MRMRKVMIIEKRLLNVGNDHVGNDHVGNLKLQRALCYLRFQLKNDIFTPR